MGERGGRDGRDPRDHRRHRPRRRMPGRGPTRRRDRARRLRRARRPDADTTWRSPGGRTTYEPEERGAHGHRPAAGEGPRPVHLPSHHRRPAGLGHATAAPGRRQAAAHGTGATARPRSAPGSCAAPGSPSPRRWTATVFTNVKLPDGYARDELLSQGLRRQGPGPRVLREDRTRQDPPGHRAGHERDRPGHERTLPAHRRARPSAGPRQARGNPRDHAQGHRQSRSDHPGTGSATCPSTSTAPDCSTRSSPAATREGASSSATNIEFSKWGTIFADDKLAASIIDRIVHHGRLIEFTGQSHRISQALMFGKPQNQ